MKLGKVGCPPERDWNVNRNPKTRCKKQKHLSQWLNVLSYPKISVFCAKYLKGAEWSFAVITEQSGKYFAVAAALMYSCFWEELHNSLKPILISLTFKEHSSCISGKNSNVNVYRFFCNISKKSPSVLGKWYDAKVQCYIFRVYSLEIFFVWKCLSRCVRCMTFCPCQGCLLILTLYVRKPGARWEVLMRSLSGYHVGQGGSHAVGVITRLKMRALQHLNHSYWEKVSKSGEKWAALETSRHQNTNSFTETQGSLYQV